MHSPEEETEGKEVAAKELDSVKEKEQEIPGEANFPDEDVV